MSVVKIESDLRKMSNAVRLVVIEFATKLVRENLPPEARLSLAEKRQKLRASGEIMLAEYANDHELTALTMLDGKEFIDA